MERPIVVDDPDALALEGAVISIGNFDGVHFGHRHLLGRMAGLATELDAPSVVVTFFPTSKLVFGDGDFLSSAEEKLELLKAFSPSAVVMIPFSREYSQTDKSVFLEQLGRLKPSAIIVGEDFRFGHKRQGTLNDLSKVTAKLEVFGLEELDGDVVKSSAIRELLAAGEVSAAARQLGGEYLVMGAAQPAPRDRAPSAVRVDVDERKALPPGIFAVRVDAAGETFGAVALALGERPRGFELIPLDPVAGLPARAVLKIRFVSRLSANPEALEKLTAEAHKTLSS